MDTISLKEYIYENKKIEYVLSEIGCHHIKYHSNKDFYSCGNYNGDNVGAINVKNNEYLNVVNWTRPKDFDSHADMIDLVVYNKQCSFVDAIKLLHKILGLEYTAYKKNDKQKDKKKNDPLAIFKRIRAASKKVNVADIQELTEKLTNDYVPLLYIGWLREGIMPWTKDRFGLAYSYKYKRVVIPHRYWLDGRLMGFNQRTTVENYNELGIRKYFLTEGMNKSINLYGLYENYDDIQKAGYVVLFEGEKSVLKRDTFGDRTCVALSGKIISKEQVRILIGLNVEIVIAMDKDVPIEEVRFMCDKFYTSRKISYIIDRDDSLGEKDSPADKGDKTYKELFQKRMAYGAAEHKKYIDSMNNK